jgi:hypothetical protein
MSTLDTQIRELTIKVYILSTTYSNLESSGASEQEKLKTAGELRDTQAILENLLKIREEQTTTNKTILTSYNTATNTLATVNTLATKSAELERTLKTNTETRKNAINTNTYYGKQYEDYKNLFILITIVCICLIASLLLAYNPRTEFISRPLSIAVGILGGSVVAYRIIEMVLRSNMNYDEYRWIAAPVTDDGIVNENNMKNKILDISGVSLGTICVGPLCCSEGTEWNSKKGCVLLKPQGISTTSETTSATSTA